MSLDEQPPTSPQLRELLGTDELILAAASIPGLELAQQDEARVRDISANMTELLPLAGGP